MPARSYLLPAGGFRRPKSSQPEWPVSGLSGHLPGQSGHLPTSMLASPRAPHVAPRSLGSRAAQARAPQVGDPYIRGAASCHGPGGPALGRRFAVLLLLRCGGQATGLSADSSGRKVALRPIVALQGPQMGRRHLASLRRRMTQGKVPGDAPIRSSDRDRSPGAATAPSSMPRATLGARGMRPPHGVELWGGG